jgi:hypothetical protein
MNKRSEEMTRPDLKYLYSVSFKKGSLSTAINLHYTLRLKSLAIYQQDFKETLKHIINKKVKVSLNIIFAYKALFFKSISQIKVNY